MKTTKHLLAITFAIFGMSAGGAHAASAAYFLQLDGIPGESVSIGHLGWINIDSFHWAITKPTSNGMTAGRSVPSPFSWTQEIDKSVPLMLGELVNNSALANATLDVAHTELGSSVFFQMKFDNVVLNKLDITGAGGVPSAAAAFDYSKLTMTYWPQDGSGRTGPPVLGVFERESTQMAFFGSPLALQGFALAMPTPSAVPVPAAVWLLGSGLLGLVGAHARRSTTPIAA